MVPAPTRPEAVLIFDSSTKLDVETVEVQALELGLRRAGFRTLLLSVALERERLTRALRGSKPAAIVLAGKDATLDVVGRIVYAARQATPGARVLEYRDATPVAGKHSVPSLGATPAEAVTALRELFESPATERPRLVEPAATADGGVARAAAGGRPGA